MTSRLSVSCAIFLTLREHPNNPLLFDAEFSTAFRDFFLLFKYTWYEITFICERVFWTPLYPAKVSTFPSFPPLEMVLDYQSDCLLSNKVRKDRKVTRHLYFPQIQE